MKLKTEISEDIFDGSLEIASIPSGLIPEDKERFKTLFENAQVGIFRTTPDGQVLAANPAFLQILGFTSFDELAKRDLESEGFSPDHPRQVFKNLIKKKGEIRNLEGIWVRKDGSLVNVSENARSIRDKNGSILYYEGTVIDITERKQSEKIQSAVYAISQAAMLSENLDDLYQAIHETLGGFMPVVNFFISLYDTENDVLTFP